MGILSWRREALFLAIAGMETCWLVSWSRVFLKRGGVAMAGPSWWNVMALYVLALVAARTLGRLELRYGTWLLGALALLTTLLLLPVAPTQLLEVLDRSDDPSAGARIIVVLLGLLVWFRALRIREQVGDTRTIARRFQLGLLLLIGAILLAFNAAAPVADLVSAYFGFGLCAVALTRLEEVAQAEAGGSTSFDYKWLLALAGALLLMVTVTLAATRLITLQVARWLLRPLTVLVQLGLLVFAALVAELAAQLLPLLQWLFGDITLEEIQQNLERFRPPEAPVRPEDGTDKPFLSPEMQRALWALLVAGLVLVALWLLVRSFRRWRTLQDTTPGAIRETVEPEATLTQDLAAFLRDQWERARQLAGLRRLLQRLGTGSARAIYANLLAVLAAAGYPRQPEQTPFEFEPMAGQALPGCEPEINAITDAYVRARYGEVQIGGEELGHLREAWNWVKTEADRSLRKNPNEESKGG